LLFLYRWQKKIPDSNLLFISKFRIPKLLNPKKLSWRYYVNYFFSQPAYLFSVYKSLIFWFHILQPSSEKPMIKNRTKFRIYCLLNIFIIFWKINSLFYTASWWVTQWLVKNQENIWSFMLRCVNYCLLATRADSSSLFRDRDFKGRKMFIINLHSEDLLQDSSFDERKEKASFNRLSQNSNIASSNTSMDT
jgi:hypothetical protein